MIGEIIKELSDWVDPNTLEYLINDGWLHFDLIRLFYKIAI